MSIRFKFRSSTTFDTVDIGDQPSISIRDLKSRIVSKKHLNVCHDFDLVFSDAISGDEILDENARVSSGSSVIIKRVPARSRESDVSPVGPIGDRCAEPPMDFGMNEFDDAEVNLFLPRDGNCLTHLKLPSNNNNEKDSPDRRCLGELSGRVGKLEATYSFELNPKDSGANDESTLLLLSTPKIEEQPKLDRNLIGKREVTERCDMPSGLKCSLCTAFFKEAVMIPCCQHSFCRKCICEELAKNRRCPICLSTKCRSEDLLPNLSLRQAIARFIESQHQQNGSENDLHGYAPDGESGIQVRDLSYAASVTQRDLKLNRSAMKGPNKSLADTKYESGALGDFTEFQGENEPQNMPGINEEANSCSRKGEGYLAVNGGGQKNFRAPSKLTKVLRTCYMCGSPDHLIKECPASAASQTGNWNGNVSFQGVVPGHAPTYWPGSPPHVSPYPNMYRGPGMMLYNTNMAPAAPFLLPSCAPAMYSPYPLASGSFNQGGMAPSSWFNAQQMGQMDHLRLKGCREQHTTYHADLEREHQFSQEHNVNRQHDSAGRVSNHSRDSFSRMPEGKHRNYEGSDDDDTYPYGKQHERAPRPIEGRRESRNAHSDTSDKAVPDRRVLPREERHEKPHRTPKRHVEMRIQHGSDSSHNYHHSNKDSMKRRRMQHEERRSDRECYSHSGSGLERSYSSGDGRQRHNESGHRSGHSKPNGKDTHHERRKLVKYSDKDYGENDHSHKRKRLH